MERTKHENQQPKSQQRILLYPLDMNIPIPNYFSKKIVPLTLLNQREHVLATERINRSEGDKKLVEIKKMLSKSLFNKDKKKALIQKQKSIGFFCGNKLDNLSVFPEKEQKQANKQLNFLIIKNNAIKSTHNITNQNNKNETTKKQMSCQIAYKDGLLRNSYEEYLIDNQQPQKDRNEIRQLLDQKFDNLLQMNFAEQEDFSIDIESRFAMEKPKRSQPQIQLIQPSLIEDRRVVHEKLLQQENHYLRQQLITFTSIIEFERERAQGQKNKAKTYKKENAGLKCKNKQFQGQFVLKEEKIYILSSQNSEYLREMKELNQQKKLLASKFQTLLRQYEVILTKLQQFEWQKEKDIQFIIQEHNKQKEIFIEQLKEKDKDILQLSEHLLDLKVKILAQQKDKESREQKANLSVYYEKIKKQENSIDEDQELQISSSICLSFAEAETLKNIIQQKEQMFQHEIDALKKINSQNQQKHLKTIQQLKNSLDSLQKSKEYQIQKQKQYFHIEIEKLKSFNYQNSLAINKKITEQQQRKDMLVNQIKLLEQRLQQSLKQQDQQLEQLLQNCVNQLEKERNLNFILHKQILKQRRTNYLMRQEMDKLQRLFTKELYFIQEIQDGKLIN